MNRVILLILFLVGVMTTAKAQYNYSVGVFYGQRFTYSDMYDDSYPLGESLGFEVGYHRKRSSFTLAL